MSRSLTAQDKVFSDIDTTYIQTFPDQVTARFYFSRKYTGFNISYPLLVDQTFKYLPNTTRNLGIGATYKWATLNLAYGFDFMNPDQGKGKTRYLDLQAHQYLGKMNIDLFGQFYRGYYLKDYTTASGEKYLREDLQVREFGAVYQYIFNHRKFSFRAAMMNSEYQKRSAGTWILGGDFFFGKVKADSSLIPGSFEVEQLIEYDELDFFKIGPNGGYAHQFVLKEHFFFLISATAHLGIGYYKLGAENDEFRESYACIDLGLKTAIGYNSNRFTVSAFFVTQRVQVSNNYRNLLNTGNLRFIVAYRFHKNQWFKKNSPN
ncbi:DUF4421 domain-containing protein [Fulvivirga sedimenti]|uniref:DUF4421 domain-containing protein n=1 Tax=Fulvivirga sedimenti TaxID=2879465 RepID=A0A9X1KX79_9BACT|nr:DUF4421 domain-containing protein [Fulvivirga sedimenti]MCA6074689.1 DUF4421 domain-containing protein [Fulvivirga sedimenti]MCA6075866.1 DUF4421 domain-containing protein [Fulvivirga sedimenti]MCA6076994.1 DUF4421 domain-containing protein [Fulvivirga sedimenti]